MPQESREEFWEKDVSLWGAREGNREGHSLTVGKTWWQGQEVTGHTLHS